MNDPFFSATECSRCGAELTARIMSKFDQSPICMECKDDERQAPGYAAADRLECDAVIQGQRNFPGAGLTQADRDFLAKKREERWLRKKAVVEDQKLDVGGRIGESTGEEAMNKTKEKPAQEYDVVGAMMDYENDSLNTADIIKLFQYIVDQHMLRGLQGFYGRRAEEMLKSGLIKPAKL